MPQKNLTAEKAEEVTPEKALAKQAADEEDEVKEDEEEEEETIKKGSKQAKKEVGKVNKRKRNVAKANVKPVKQAKK